ncbi:CIA30 family protein [Mycolicibacterium sp. GCM10028919]|uniref:CIA30 family protein n=1 Tax=Mycolicibacterium sp. GCM10028919 TaxID=3273401 RepID=UPI00361BCB82
MSTISWLRRGRITLLVCSAVLMVSCGSTERTADADPPAASGIALVDLDDAGEVAAWTTVNDPVMGGMSTSRVTFGDAGLVFSGNVSLENNGGFASARSPLNPGVGRRATGAKSFRVHALGDGKTYLLKVGIEGQPWSYVQRFPTQAAVQRIYDLPIGGFTPVGMRLDPEPSAPRNLDPSTIDQVAVYILDEQQGPFELSVSAIDATA